MFDDEPSAWPDAPAGTLDAAPPDDEGAPWPDDGAVHPVATTGRESSAPGRAAPLGRPPASRAPGAGREPMPASLRPAVEALRAVFPGRVLRFVPEAPSEPTEAATDTAVADAIRDGDGETTGETRDGGPT